MKHIFIVLTAVLLAPMALHASDAGRKPNILFILADDLGWRDLGCYGSTFHRTPNLDKLAARGVKFTQAYSASPLCSPTRASILTGLAPARLGITEPNCHLAQILLEKGLAKGGPNQRVLVAAGVTRLKTDYRTLPQALREAGYATGHFGKWHLGGEPYSPLQHGFDVDVPHTPGPGPGGGNGYFAPWQFWKGEGKPGDHIEDRMAEEAVKFLRANKDRPFFLNYWAFSVHSPWMAKEPLVAAAAKRAEPGAAQRHPVYAAMVQSLDDAVGRLLDTLDELKLSENTLIVFTSDNGGWHNVAKEATNDAAYAGIPVTSNAPLRSGKASNYEGGTRVPLIVAWPGKIAPATESGALFQSTDFFPTLLEACGVKPQAGQRFDGVSQMPALRGMGSPREVMFSHFPHGGRADIEGFLPGTWVRRGDWKLIRFHAANDDGSDRLELFNLRDDLGESKNLAAEKPDIVRELNALITQFLADTEAVVPVRNPAYRAAPAPAAAKSVLGWQAGGDASLREENGRLLVRSTGRDPQLVTRDLPPDVRGPFVVKLRLASTASGDGMLYFADAAKGGFRKEQSVSFPIAHDGQPHDYEVKLPGSSLRALRLDPGNAPGDITIERLELRDAAGAVVRTWLAPKQARIAPDATPFPEPGSKKGLQVQMTDDALALGIRHATVNCVITGWPALAPRPQDIRFTARDGREYAFRAEQVAAIDRQVAPLSRAGVLVYLVLLARETGEAARDALVLHPRYDRAAKTNRMAAFNTATDEGRAWFVATAEFLAARYSGPETPHGRVWGYIVGNEVNSHWWWYNLGRAPLETVAAEYERAVRLVHGAVRTASENARVYLSFEHHWAMRYPPGTAEQSAPGRDLLDAFARQARERGDFDWHVAFHPYPENLGDPRAWLDKTATPADDSPRVTFKNLDVLTRHLARDELRWQGEPRRVILSEQGLNCREDLPDGEQRQAAGFAYAWMKVNALAGIDAFILHRHVDHEHEGGAHFGLWSRREGTLNEPDRPRLLREVFRAAGTPEQDSAFAFALPIVGLKSWNELRPKVTE